MFRFRLSVCDGKIGTSVSISLEKPRRKFYYVAVDDNSDAGMLNRKLRESSVKYQFVENSFKYIHFIPIPIADRTSSVLYLLFNPELYLVKYNI